MFIEQISDLLWDHAEIQQTGPESVVCLVCGAVWRLDLYSEGTWNERKDGFDLVLENEGNGECIKMMYEA